MMSIHYQTSNDLSFDAYKMIFFQHVTERYCFMLLNSVQGQHYPFFRIVVKDGRHIVYDNLNII